MALDTHRVTFFLNKIIILLGYTGVSSLKFNSLSNQFEKCPDWIATTKFVCSCFLAILYFANLSQLLNFAISKMFVLNISSRIYIYMTFALLCSIIILNKKHENVIMDILNELEKFQSAMENFRYKRSLKETAIISAMFVETIYRLMSGFVRIFYQFSSIRKTSNNVLYFQISFMFVFEYSSVVKILSEGALLLSYLVITQYCDHFSKSFHVNDRRASNKFQSLLEVARKLNKIFSVLFLLYIALYFLSILMWAMLIYCSIHDNKGKILNNVEIVGLVLAFWKLIMIITIPSETMKKVGECNFFKIF
jgi:predicted nucleic acid-binding Zn ribbon protein